MIVLSMVYPCNFGCPNCPYTDGNSEIRKFYAAHRGELFPPELWRKIADEAGPHRAWLRCTGGGEPTRMSGPALSILRRKADGQWVIHRDANMVTPAK